MNISETPPPHSLIVYKFIAWWKAIPLGMMIPTKKIGIPTATGTPKSFSSYVSLVHVI